VLPNKGNFQFFEPDSYFQRVIITEIYLTKMKALDGSDQPNSKGGSGPYVGASIYYDTVIVLPNNSNFQFF
jgi:hypothetical protein